MNFIKKLFGIKDETVASNSTEHCETIKGMNMLDYEKIQHAYTVLVNALENKKARKVDLTTAMLDAIGYLREVTE